MTKPIQKQKFVGMEAPAVRVTMASGEMKVIGMMAEKVQVMVTLPSAQDLNDKLLESIEKYQKQSLIYIISPETIDRGVDSSMVTADCEIFSLKYGVFMPESGCAKSLFIINKEGEIEYRELVVEEDAPLDIEAFDEALGKAIAFKAKGHTHENWMSV
jgi:thiol peroxidase